MRGSAPQSSRTVVYLLDVSTSMRPHQAQARQELLTRISALGEGDQFNVLAFAGDVRRFAEAPVSRNESSTAGVEAWLAALPESSGTCPEPALAQALATPAVTSVVLVSDAETTAGEHWARLAEVERTQNASRAFVLAVTLGALPDDAAGDADRNVPGRGIISMLVAGETQPSGSQ